jgi:hypothetical protein
MLGLVSAAEGYLDTTQSQLKSKASAESKALEGEDQEVARELVRFGADALVKAYKDSTMSLLIKTVAQNIRLDLDSSS